MSGIHRSGRRVLRACLLGAALMGCAHWPFGGEGRGPVQETTLPELLDRIGARTSGLESIRALLAIEANGSQSFLAGVTWAHPERLRVEGLSPVGSTLFELTVTGEMVRWREPGRAPEVLGTVDSIRQNPDARKRGLPLSIEDLVFLLRALTGPVIEDGEVALMEKASPFYILHVARVQGDRGRLTKRIFIDGRRLRMDRENAFRPDGTSGIRMRFLDYTPTDHGDWPFRIIVDLPRNGLEVALVFKELKFDSPVTPEEFDLAVGGGP